MQSSLFFKKSKKAFQLQLEKRQMVKLASPRLKPQSDRHRFQFNLPISDLFLGFQLKMKKSQHQICYIITHLSSMAADRRRTSETQMADINAQLANQNDTIRTMLRVANETDATTNNIQGQLQRQREKLQKNVQKTQEIKHEVKKADKKTNQMRRRNICIKAVLWIVAIILFAANIGLIIYKAKSM